MMVVSFFITFLIAGLITLKRTSAKGFATSADVVATNAMDTVVATAPACRAFIT